MHVLISNDDGIFAPGIKALAEEAAKRGHKVSIFAPDSQRSAAGHAITLTRPLHAKKEEFDGMTAYAIDGTPADCVRLGIHMLGEDKPDFVLSGINAGPNRGGAILYSGTVSAAMEGSMCGVPSAAVSRSTFKDDGFETSARLGVDLMEWAVNHPLPRGEIYNLNVPYGDVIGMKQASVSNEFICDAVYNQLEDGSYMIANTPDVLPEIDPNCDLLLTRAGYATLSILTWNLEADTRMDDISDLAGRV